MKEIFSKFANKAPWTALFIIVINALFFKCGVYQNIISLICVGIAVFSLIFDIKITFYENIVKRLEGQIKNQDTKIVKQDKRIILYSDQIIKIQKEGMDNLSQMTQMAGSSLLGQDTKNKDETSTSI